MSISPRIDFFIVLHYTANGLTIASDHIEAETTSVVLHVSSVSAAQASIGNYA